MPIHDIIYYSTFICLLNLESVESGCGKEGEKIKMKLKAFFIVFEGLLFGEKKRIADTNLKTCFFVCLIKFRLTSVVSMYFSVSAIWLP